jgi:hypothetical protein
VPFLEGIQDRIGNAAVEISRPKQSPVEHLLIIPKGFSISVHVLSWPTYDISETTVPSVCSVFIPMMGAIPYPEGFAS